jgi:phosphatidylglycerol:prolipoprotein diacylglycerol transferase
MPNKQSYYMLPHIVVLGRDIGMYTLMILCGIFSLGIYTSKMAKIHKYDNIKIIIFLLVISTGVIAGSHLLYALVNYKNFMYVFINIKKIDTFEKALNALSYTLGGSVFYGGLIGGIIVAYICIRKDNEYKLFVDIVAVSIPLFHFWGRIGCFLGGCCYGIPGKIGFTYLNSPIVKANGIKRFPVQLCEAFINLILFFILSNKYISEKFKGNLLVLYLFIYSVARFFTELLRGDAYRGIWLYLSTSQWISILVFIVSSRILWGKNIAKNLYDDVRN